MRTIIGRGELMINREILGSGFISSQCGMVMEGMLRKGPGLRPIPEPTLQIAEIVPSVPDDFQPLVALAAPARRGLEGATGWPRPLRDVSKTKLLTEPLGLIN